MNRKPLYLLAGGRSSGPSSVSGFLAQVYKECGCASPRVAYVGAASDDNLMFYGMIGALLKSGGAGKIDRVMLASPRANASKALTLLESADVIFISGGDVERGMQVLNEKKMIEAFRRLYDEGKVFFGASAGSIMMAAEWVRWSDPEDDSTAELFPCLGFAPLICDTHGEQDKWEELKAALMLKKSPAIGYGIASGTALKVNPDGSIAALGGAVHRFERMADKVVRTEDLTPSPSRA